MGIHKLTPSSLEGREDKLDLCLLVVVVEAQAGLSGVKVGGAAGAVGAAGEDGKTQEPHTHTPPTSPSSRPHITCKQRYQR